MGTPSTEGWNQHETARVNHTAGYADKCCAASRAIMSVLPPAPNGTTMVTGLEGQSAATIGSETRTMPASHERTTSSLSARCISFPLTSAEVRALRICWQGRHLAIDPRCPIDMAGRGPYSTSPDVTHQIDSLRMRSTWPGHSRHIC